MVLTTPAEMCASTRDLHISTPAKQRLSTLVFIPVQQNLPTPMVRPRIVSRLMVTLAKLNSTLVFTPVKQKFSTLMLTPA